MANALWATQAQQHFAAGYQLKCILRHGRTQHVAAEVLKAHTIAGTHSDLGVQVEAAKVSVPRAAAPDHRRGGRTAEAQPAFGASKALAYLSPAAVQATRASLMPVSMRPSLARLAQLCVSCVP